ncbi:hypothetical protein [Ectobacillus funiculus]|uniref:Uncharacterized protein n=1 Tax=Ectobacillus funiculus TaxID=137993 RepID=A0ABV5WMD8_9BACI
MTISFDYSNALSFMQQNEVDNLSEFVKVAHKCNCMMKNILSA